MLRTNLRNQVRQTPLPKWKPLIPLFEAVMNSFQAVRDAQRRPDTGRILIEIERERTLLPDDESPPIKSFKITDNGIGLNDDNFDSFNTAFSDYKYNRGGKGLGRFTWLKAFERVKIDSVFSVPEDPGKLRRTFVFDEDYDPDKAFPVPERSRPIGTVVQLQGFKEPYQSEGSKTTDQIVQALVEHFLLIFLEPDCPTVELHDFSFKVSANAVFEKEFKTVASKHPFKIKGIEFTLHGFHLATPKVSKHKLIYAANQRGVVSDNLADYLPNLATRLPSPEGGTFVYLGIVQSPYLTEHVNPARTDFDLTTAEDADVEQEDLFKDEIRRTEIRDECLKNIQADLAEIIQGINEAKEEKVRQYVQAEAPQYKILMKYSGEFIDKISPTATKPDIEAALHRELYQREVRLKAESSRIIKEAEKVDDYEDYRRRFEEFMERYNELGVSALAQYVQHRKIILEHLERAISLPDDSRAYPLEEVVHKLVYPMRSTSDETAYSEQNLWLIDERLTYHSFIASDKKLSSLPTFVSDSAKRPDLFIWDRQMVFGEGEAPVTSITIVEFKRPQRNNYKPGDNPITQAFDLVKQIRAGTFLKKGRPIPATPNVPAFCYIIADITSSLKEVLEMLDAYPTPDGQGYYGFQKTFGIYYEVLDYDKLLNDAKKRNRIFFDKLNVLGNR